jgi:hypothetical protein
MTNPLVHAIVLAAAVLIPGGLLVYFAWRAISLKGGHKHTAQNPGSEDIPTPKEARSDFESMFPAGSLRAQSRLKQLDRVKAFRHRNSKN